MSYLEELLKKEEVTFQDPEERIAEALEAVRQFEDTPEGKAYWREQEQMESLTAGQLESIGIEVYDSVDDYQLW